MRRVPPTDTSNALCEQLDQLLLQFEVPKVHLFAMAASNQTTIKPGMAKSGTDNSATADTHLYTRRMRDSRCTKNSMCTLRLPSS